MAEALTCPECGGDAFTVERPDDDNQLVLRCVECPEAPAFVLTPTLALEREEPPLEPDPRLLNRLREWRRQQGEREDVPLYMVLPNRTLEALAAAPPETPDELLAVPGIGEVKLDKYGDELLDLLARHGAAASAEASLEEFGEEPGQAP